MEHRQRVVLTEEHRLLIADTARLGGVHVGGSTSTLRHTGKGDKYVTGASQDRRRAHSQHFMVVVDDAGP